MITQLTTLSEFLGLITHVDPSQVPLGGAIKCKNLAQLSPGRLRRIPGITALSSPIIDASTRIPLAFVAKGLGAGGADQTIAIFMGASVVSVVNITTGLAMTGPSLAAPSFTKQWTATFYNNKWMFAGGGNGKIFQLDSASAYSEVVGTNLPAAAGNIIQSFLNRLYSTDIAAQPGLVAFTDVLTTNFTNFPTGNIVNVRELPGDITALATNSPTTDKEGIYTQLIIAKHTAIWNYDEIRKDVVSQVIGIANSHVAVNTEAGLIFIGHKGTRHSVFWLPIGSEGEPINIGEPLNDYLNNTVPIDNEYTAHAISHDRFYKLFYSSTGQNNNPNEFWLDTYLLASEKKVRWYGPHGRGSFDASAVTESTLEFFVRGSGGSNKRYQENISADSNFVDANGTALTAELDLPVNVDPQPDEKVFDVIELQVAKEANVSGNQVSVEPIAEGASQGVQSVSLFDSTSAGISRVLLPFHATGETGMAARDARMRITQTINQRLDILGASIQYLYHEGKSHVRSKI